LCCNAQSCAELGAEFKAALQRSSTNSSEPRCSAAPRTARSRATAHLHKEGDGSCPSPSFSWGCLATPCFFFLATLCCIIAAFFFLFSCCYATELPSPSYMVGIFFFALLLLML
jgi:hypothetical protein